MKIQKLEPMVLKALTENPKTRGDNFILYIEVLENFIDTNTSLAFAFLNHKQLGLPSLESITRCRRKLQERDPSLKDEFVSEMREEQEEEYKDYALADKQWY